MKIYWWLIFALLLLQGTVLYAKSCEYGEHLLRERRYPAAVLEFERFLYYDAKSGADSLYAHRAIVRAYYGAGLYDEVWEYGQKHQLLEKSPEYQRRILALARLRQGDYAMAALLSEPEQGSPSLILKGIAELYRGDNATAKAIFELLPEDSGEKQELLGINQRAQNITQKKPWLAVSLALLPGGGYLYNNKWQTALSALALHAIFFGSAYEMYSKELYISSTLLFALGTGYYVGSIYGSVNETMKYNRRHREAYLDTNLREYIWYLEDAGATWDDHHYLPHQ